jgi:integrase
MTIRFSTSQKPKVKFRNAASDSQTSTFNPAVSQLSRFLDEVWDFAEDMTIPSVCNLQKRVSWGFRIKHEELFTDPKYKEMLCATRQLFHSLLQHTEEGPAQKPASILHYWSCLKQFLTYLASRPRPILSYDQVSPELIASYAKQVRKTRSNATVYSHFRVIEYLFLYRRKMCCFLLFDPFVINSAAKEAGYTSAYREQHRTEYIPDEILKDLIRSAIEYLTVWGPPILEASTRTTEVRKREQNINPPPKKTVSSPNSKHKRKSKKEVAYEDSVRYQMRGELRRFVQELPPTLSAVRPNLSNLNELYAARVLLRTVCIILLAFVTGIRLSELLSIKAGCIEIENTPDGEFIWLHSTLFKTPNSSEGVPAKWLGGQLALQAVSMLEQLTREIRQQSGCSYLIVPVTPLGVIKWNGKVPLAEGFESICGFLDFIHLKDRDGQPFHVHAHMFRRTFARHVVRCDTTNLLALKEHFKHCSVAMTDGYVGIDLDLQDLLDSENDLLSLDSFDKALRSPNLSGRQGKAIVAMVDDAIADGRLPVEFRGEAGGHFRKKMAREFIEAGQRIYPCGASNFCWFREDSADCTKDDKPVVEICNPVGCANSVIEQEEHGEYWQNIVTEGENLLAMKPKGGPYKARLISITRIAKKIVSDFD